MALTDDKSVLLKISLSALVFWSSESLESLALRSPKISLISLIFPSLSATLTPSSFNLAEATSVGDVNDKSIFLRCVPPSAPLIPLLASIPREVHIVSTSCPVDLTVPAHWRMPSPSIATVVLDFWAVLAIMSI